MEKITEELENYKFELFDTEGKCKTDDNFVQKYKKSFKTSKDADKESIILIKNIIRIIKPSHTFVNDRNEGYSEYFLNAILLTIHEKITEIYQLHQKRKKFKPVVLTSKEIIEIIKSDPHSVLDTTEYLYFKAWSTIEKILEDAPQKISCGEENCVTCSTKDMCNLLLQKKMLADIPINKRNDFIYKLLLFEPEYQKANNLPDDNLINRLFTKLLKSINSLSLNEKNIICMEREATYRLSLDSSSEIEELLGKISNSISSDRKPDNQLLLYETDFLIVDQLNDMSLVYDGNNIMVMRENKYNDLEKISSHSLEKQSRNYFKPKKYKQ